MLERQLRDDVDPTDERSVADMLIELADGRCELFRDPDRVAYALLDGGSHCECWPVRSDGSPQAREQPRAKRAPPTTDTRRSRSEARERLRKVQLRWPVRSNSPRARSLGGGHNNPSNAPSSRFRIWACWRPDCQTATDC